MSSDKIIILLEGCDGAGKSTVAQNLKLMFERLEGKTVEIVHFGVPDLEIPVVETYIGPVRKAFLQKNPDVIICDRWAVGEVVYGEILRGKNRATVDDMASLYEKLEYNFDDIRYWYVRPEIGTVLRRFKERGDDLIKIDQIVAIYNRYDDLMLGDEDEFSQPLLWEIIPEQVQDVLAKAATS